MCQVHSSEYDSKPNLAKAQKNGPGIASGAVSLFRLSGGYLPTIALMVFWPCGEPRPPTRS